MPAATLQADELRSRVMHARGLPGRPDSAHPPGVLVPIARQLFADALTPVLAYRRLVRGDDRLAPSFLYESVFNGEQVGRYSYLGARPAAEFIARGRTVTRRDPLGLLGPATPAPNADHEADAAGDAASDHDCADPLAEAAGLTAGLRSVDLPGLPDYPGGWVGYVGYDAVRYLEGDQLPHPPADDRHLPDLHLQLYTALIVFDHAQKTVMALAYGLVPGDIAESDLDTAIARALEGADHDVDRLVEQITTPHPDEAHALPPGEADLRTPPPDLPPSNMGDGGYQRAVARCREYIAAGDAFQIVPSQRFRLNTPADPFDIYRALRVINPSPYLFYLQVSGAILVGSSPEILCRVRDGEVTSRPLAGTRRRGRTAQDDLSLARALREDPKDVAEHVMLVDLHRNDVGRVAVPGSVRLPEVLVIERYSHVMHLSSTVTGRLADGLTCWDALRVTLPVGTVSGAPKVRAMQIIDELEPTRRGPYGGAVGHVDLLGNMDMAIALRTMVITPEPSEGAGWTVDIQAGAGIVADSDPQAEHEETVNKAAALAKAVALAQEAFRHDAD